MLVLVVEDDSFTRLSIASTLRILGYSVCQASSASEGLRVGRELLPAAALIDLHLGLGPNGIELSSALRSLNPEIGVVFLTSYASPRLLDPKQKLPKGSIYLNKSQVAESEVLSRALEASVKHHPMKNDFVSKLDKLTDLQLETVRLVAQGYSNSEIAKKRFVTEATVEKTLSRVAKELGLELTPARNQRVRIAKAYLREVPTPTDAP